MGLGRLLGWHALLAQFVPGLSALGSGDSFAVGQFKQVTYGKTKRSLL